jgi:UDP-N-acetylglucosamine 4-epimerase
MQLIRIIVSLSEPIVPRIETRRPMPGGLWAITGVAGFIGSNLLQRLLSADQQVVGFDSFATGSPANLEDVQRAVTPQQWARFSFSECDILDQEVVTRRLEGVDCLLHQAALGSVPRSIENPLATNAANVTGFLTVLEAARASGVRRVVYASSSSVYGDARELPQREGRVGKPLSPYAASKQANEAYAAAYAQCHGMALVGLRYFNVFGPRQNPRGPYAAVIPQWIAALVRGDPLFMNGDGTTSRDFCCVDNVVHANLLAATGAAPGTSNVYNVAGGEQTSLAALFQLLADLVAERIGDPAIRKREPIFRDFRPGDLQHSLADLTAIGIDLGYRPVIGVRDGLRVAVDWFCRTLDGK